MALGLAGSTKGKSQPLGWWEGAFKMQMSVVEPRDALLFDWDPFCLYSPVWAMMRRGLAGQWGEPGGPSRSRDQQRGCSGIPDEGRPQLQTVLAMLEPSRGFDVLRKHVLKRPPWKGP